MDAQKWIEDRTIMLTLGGSHAYGTNIESSDEDFRGVAIAPLDHYFGLQRFDQLVLKDPDMQIYDLKKFFHLASQCNPNIIELLFTSSHIKKEHAWDLVLYNRELFLSKKAKFTFSGYAIAQLKRIKGHRVWIENPPKDPKTLIFPSPGASDKMDEAMFKWNQYQTWLKERNPARAKLEIAHGYDTKHAMHLIRLLRMGIEILRDGKVNTDRTGIDADELLAIRNGSLSYDELIEMAEYYEACISDAYDHSDLPNSVDQKKINKLLVSILSEYLENNPGVEEEV